MGHGGIWPVILSRVVREAAKDGNGTTVMAACLSQIFIKQGPKIYGAGCPLYLDIRQLRYRSYDWLHKICNQSSKLN